MAHDRCNCYFSFWAILFPFNPITAQNIKIPKKWKITLEISSLYTGATKIMIMSSNVPEIQHVMDVTVVNAFLPFLSPHSDSPKNEKFKKMKKMPQDIIILHKCTKNHDHMLCCSWDMVCDRCNYFSF